MISCVTTFQFEEAEAGSVIPEMRARAADILASTDGLRSISFARSYAAGRHIRLVVVLLWDTGRPIDTASLLGVNAHVSVVDSQFYEHILTLDSHGVLLDAKPAT